MEMTQINTRIPADLKKQGDEVLARFGLSVSEVIRSVWTYMAEKQRVPDFALSRSNEAAFEDKIRLIEACSQSVSLFAKDAGIDITGQPTHLPTLEEDLYEDLLDEYEALNA